MYESWCQEQSMDIHKYIYTDTHTHTHAHTYVYTHINGYRALLAEV